MRRRGTGRAGWSARPAGQLSLLALVLASLTLGLLWLRTGTASLERPWPAPLSPQRSGAVAELAAGRASPPSASASTSTGEELRQTIGALEPTPNRPQTRLELRVLERDAHGPVAGAQVHLIGREPSGAECERAGVTDASGRVQLSWPAELAAGLKVVHPDYADIARPLVPLDGGEITIELELGGRILGQLVAAAGTELDPDLKLLLWSSGPKGIRGEPEQSCSARGVSFEFRDLARGEYAISALGDRANLAFVAGVHVEPGQEVRLSLPLSRTASLALRALESIGEELVADAQVRFEPAAQGLHESVVQGRIQEGRTDELGQLRFERLPLGPARLELRTSWGTVVSRGLELVAGENPELLLRVPPSAGLSGIVIGSGAVPQVGARVLVAQMRDTDEARWKSPSPPAAGDGFLARTETDELGRFAFEALPASEKLIVAVWPAGGAVGEDGEIVRFGERVVLSPGEQRGDLRIALEVGGGLDLRVVDEAGDPLAAEVVLEVLVGRAWMRWERADCDAQGQLSCSNIPPGLVRLTVEAEGHEQLETKLTVPLPSKGRLQRTLRLDPVGRLTGWVVDEYGNAISSARVQATGQDGGKRVQRWKAVDEFGRFELGGLALGPWSVQAEAVGWRPIVVEPLQLTLPDQDFASFQLTPDLSGLPASVSGEVALRGSGEPVTGLHWNNLRGGVLSVDGANFSISGMRPGRVRLLVETPGFERVGFESFDLAPGAALDLGRLELRRASQLDVRLLDRNGRGLSRARLWLEAPPGSKPAASGRKRGPHLPLKGHGRAGSYRAPAVPRGQWTLRASLPDGGGTLSELVDLRRAHESVTLKAKELLAPPDRR